MTNAAQNTTAGDNIAAALAALDKDMAKLGAESVNVARPKLALSLVRAAADGIIDEDDVEARYDVYLAGREKTQAKQALAMGVEEGNGKKANVSKCRQLVRMAMLSGIDGPELLDRTVTARGNLIGTDSKIEAPFDAFVKVARAQIAQPDAPLTDDQIAEQVRKPEKGEKTEIQKLIDLYKSTAKMVEALPGNAAIKDAASSLADAIVEEGGEVPALTKEEKEEQAAMAYLARRGLVVVPAITKQMPAE
jgi:hypothetical protein